MAIVLAAANRSQFILWCLLRQYSTIFKWLRRILYLLSC